MLETKTRDEIRSSVSRQRQAPCGARSAIIGCEDDGSLSQVESAPAELRLNATDADGEVAVWFDDAWWMELLGKWSDEPMTIHIEPTREALLHPVVLHHIEMLRRVAPRWRVVGHGYITDVGNASSAVAIARSAYHDVRILDCPRPGVGAADVSGQLTVSELFQKIRQEQERISRSRPILTRVPAETASSSEGQASEVARTA